MGGARPISDVVSHDVVVAGAARGDDEGATSKGDDGDREGDEDRARAARLLVEDSGNDPFLGQIRVRHEGAGVVGEVREEGGELIGGQRLTADGLLGERRDEGRGRRRGLRAWRRETWWGGG